MARSTHSSQHFAQALSTRLVGGRWWGVLLVILVLAVGYLGLTPQPPQGLDTGWDKLNHVLAFAALAFAAVMSYSAPGGARLLMLLALLAFGGSIEVLQGFVPGRASEWNDLFADFVGIVFGAAVAVGVLRFAALPLALNR
jgi:VanZ family protein